MLKHAGTDSCGSVGLNAARRGRPLRNTQGGSFLIEALLGILIFSMGILALVGMQASAISAQSDARYRIEAANLADRMADNVWLNVDRSSAANLQTSLAAYAHMTGGSTCSYTGSASANTIVTDWVTAVTAAGSGLPGTSAAMQQILIDTTAAGYNKVTVTICWRAPKATANSRLTTVTYVN